MYKAIDLTRLLIRHGAEIFPVMSSGSNRLLTSEIMKWASGNNVITKLSANLEHIFLADYNRSDLILVYPGIGKYYRKDSKWDRRYTGYIYFECSLGIEDTYTYRSSYAQIYVFQCLRYH